MNILYSISELIHCLEFRHTSADSKALSRETCAASGENKFEKTDWLPICTRTAASNNFPESSLTTSSFSPSKVASTKEDIEQEDAHATYLLSQLERWQASVGTASTAESITQSTLVAEEEESSRKDAKANLMNIFGENENAALHRANCSQ